MSFSRRKFLTLAGTTAAGVTMVSPLEAFYARVANGQVATGIGFGPLEPKLPVNTKLVRIACIANSEKCSIVTHRIF